MINGFLSMFSWYLCCPENARFSCTFFRFTVPGVNAGCRKAGEKQLRCWGCGAPRLTWTPDPSPPTLTVLHTRMHAQGAPRPRPRHCARPSSETTPSSDVTTGLLGSSGPKHSSQPSWGQTCRSQCVPSPQPFPGSLRKVARPAAWGVSAAGASQGRGGSRGRGWDRAG